MLKDGERITTGKISSDDVFELDPTELLLKKKKDDWNPNESLWALNTAGGILEGDSNNIHW